MDAPDLLGSPAGLLCHASKSWLCLLGHWLLGEPLQPMVVITELVDARIHIAS